MVFTNIMHHKVFSGFFFIMGKVMIWIQAIRMLMNFACLNHAQSEWLFVECQELVWYIQRRDISKEVFFGIHLSRFSLKLRFYLKAIAFRRTFRYADEARPQFLAPQVWRRGGDWCRELCMTSCHAWYYLAPLSYSLYSYWSIWSWCDLIIMSHVSQVWAI